MKKHSITVCMGSSCFARGNRENLQLIEKFIALHGLEDKIDLAGSCCAGKCSGGPNVVIDGRLFNAMDSAALIDVLNKTLKEN